MWKRLLVHRGKDKLVEMLHAISMNLSAIPQHPKNMIFTIFKTIHKFLQKRGHTPIKTISCLAKRWRDDVFLVGASIYDFQPWVTSGLVEPPANPLVVAQPSIRLNDVDNVGRTGRHMTCFTMGAHHAFNTSRKNSVLGRMKQSNIVMIL